LYEGANSLVIIVLVELEPVEEIAQCRTVQPDLGIVVRSHRVREIVPAPIGQRFQMPVSLDEL
jgi:hypothetical protein